MKWSETVHDYYPVTPQPRWGFGKATHEGIRQVLEASRATYEANLDDVERHQEALVAIPFDPSEKSLQPFWNNIWFSCLDAVSLVSFLLTRRPKHYFEIGSGHSTLFARHAIEFGKLATTITSIDPQPRAEIDSICDRTIRTPLEGTSVEVFGELLPGDILFFDGSHRVFTNSDVTAFFFDVLPSLRPGVLVHIHDVFLPADYPPAWNGRLYSEQYILGAMLLCGAPHFRVMLPNFFICTDDSLGKRVREIFAAKSGHEIPFLYANDAQNPGNSFWIEKIEPGHQGMPRPFGFPRKGTTLPKRPEAWPMDKLRLVDVGAAGGVQPNWLPYADRIMPILFEPNPAEAAKLRQTIGSSFDNAVILETGLSNVVGPRRLNITRYWGCTSLLQPNTDTLSNYRVSPLFDVTSTEALECTRYDVLYSEGAAPAPDLIKIGVQGFEYEILQGFGGLLQTCLGIQLTTHVYPIYKNQKLLHHLISFLADFGFVLRALAPAQGFDGDVVELVVWFTKDIQAWRRLDPSHKEYFRIICAAWNLIDYSRIDPAAHHNQVDPI